MDFVTDLGLDDGLTAVVGAGGKKSTIYTVADELDRAVVTTTVRIPFFDEHVATVLETDRPRDALESVTDWPVGLVPGYEENRYLGYEPHVVDTITESQAPEAILVKADGARNRDFKAPGENEPRIPETADRVLGIASVAAVGKPLDEEWVHRPERVAALTGLEPGDPIGVEDMATVLSSPRGTEKGVPESATFLPVLNKVDDDTDLETAREIADRVLESGRATQVALTHLLGPGEPLLELRS
ncbi:selenium cofactor biosynthesis protein YqeC [Halodesulfurarchaeum formicicum]|uniref:Anaerobic dehydrogenase n=1 Tax=Halodesulfurarchaeum formicicum TaxID=1873524 RepID=A0A1J1ADM9_9EURY|nr:selenium cofactor biosynthesis protein YqeC [Halodesulfurarchaeum formicicum]APE96244.1 anaerobic dehydrogenase [Halodesulfurarchaeum formicicum]